MRVYHLMSFLFLFVGCGQLSQTDSGLKISRSNPPPSITKPQCTFDSCRQILTKKVFGAANDIRHIYFDGKNNSCFWSPTTGDYNFIYHCDTGKVEEKYFFPTSSDGS